MQFFGQDIRSWGNKKIMQNFASSAGAQSAFIERLRIQNMLLGICRSTAYSIPRDYPIAHERIGNLYYGMVAFMNNCEPLILSMDSVGKPVQRKFKNQWDSCWNNFGKSIGLDECTIRIISELGVRLFYSISLADIPESILEFYNAVLKWYVYTSTEGALAETDLTPLELVERMILQSPALFVHDIQVGF